MFRIELLALLLIAIAQSALADTTSVSPGDTASVEAPNPRLWMPPAGSAGLPAYAAGSDTCGPYDLSEPARDIQLAPVRPGGESGAPHSLQRQSGSLGSALKWSLLAVSAGSAAIALNFKNRADEAYDDYLHTGHSARMREAFDRAERNDRYALGCWVAAEVSLVAFLYLLTKSPAESGWGVSAQFDEVDGKCALGVRCEF